MSVSRLNFTGRKRIPRERVSIGLSGVAPNAQLGATFNLDGLGFPETARVVLEAQAGWAIQRFEFGEVGQYREPAERTLSEFQSHSGLLFRLKVIATGEFDGRLLGVADRLKAAGTTEDSSQQAFVVVRAEDLGDRVWRVDFDEGQPLLLVNNRLPDHQDFLKRRDVAALLLPEVLQRILEQAVEIGGDEDVEADWQSMALRLGERLAGRNVPAARDPEEIARWIDEAVSAFARRHEFIDVFLAEGIGAFE